MIKILIMGGGGFIGKNLANYFMDNYSFKVTVADIKSIRDIETNLHPKIKILPSYDLSKYSYMESALADSYDIVYQLAADMGGMGYIGAGSHDANIMTNSSLINLNLCKVLSLSSIKPRVFYSSSACFLSGTKVFSDKGYLSIEDVTLNDKVMGHDGKYHKVLKTIKTEYTGDIVEVKGLGASNIFCTPDHRFLMSNNKWEQAKDINNKISKQVIPDLSGSSFISLPPSNRIESYHKIKNSRKAIYKEAALCGVSQGTAYKWHNSDSYPTRLDPLVKDTVVKNFNLGRLLGLVLSEGWYESNKSCSSERIVCAFGKHERQLINEYKALLNSELGIPFDRIVEYDTRTAIKVHVTSKRLVSLISTLAEIKNGSHCKKLTMDGMTGPEEYRKGILAGANEGDGSTQKVAHGNFNRSIFATVSQDLARQYSLILSSLGIYNSISIRPAQSWSIEGRSGITLPVYQIYDKSKETRLKVLATKQQSNVFVYNLEVEDCHSYLVEGLPVHNCVYPTRNQLDPKNPLCSEDSAYPADPMDEYGWEKLFSERLYKAYEKNYNLDVRIARFHNIYGPLGCYDGGREKAPAALCRKIALAKSGDTIEVWGSGEQTRSFLYIDECIKGMMRLMASDIKEIINIGSEEMVSINQMVNMIADIAGKKIHIKNIDGKPVGVQGRNSDNRLIKKLLGWAPDYPLAKGLEATYRWISDDITARRLR